MGLGNDVADAHHIENGAHRAAGDNAVPGGSGSQNNLAGAETAGNVV